LAPYGVTIGRKTYMVGKSASIMVDGEKAGVSDLAAGMRALVTGKVMEKGKTTEQSLYRATRITARTSKKAPKGERRAQKYKRDRKWNLSLSCRKGCE
jgi:hypothetical protein